MFVKHGDKWFAVQMICSNDSLGARFVMSGYEFSEWLHAFNEKRNNYPEIREIKAFGAKSKVEAENYLELIGFGWNQCLVAFDTECVDIEV